MYDPNRGYPRVVPYVLYKNAEAAVSWLNQTLGTETVLRYEMPDGSLGMAEVALGDFIIMIGSRDEPTPAEHGHTSAMAIIFVDDVDEACRQAVVGGGSIVEEAEDRPWGLRQATVADPAGHRWELSQHQRDVPVADWGAEQVGRMPG